MRLEKSSQLLRVREMVGVEGTFMQRSVAHGVKPYHAPNTRLYSADLIPVHGCKPLLCGDRLWLASPYSRLLRENADSFAAEPGRKSPCVPQAAGSRGGAAHTPM